MQISRTYELSVSWRAVMLAFFILIAAFMADDVYLQISLAVIFVVYVLLVSLLSHVSTAFKLTRDSLLYGRNLKNIMHIEDMTKIIVYPRKKNFNFFYNIKGRVGAVSIYNVKGVKTFLVDNTKVFADDLLVKAKHINDNIKVIKRARLLFVFNRIIAFFVMAVLFLGLPLVIIKSGTVEQRYRTFFDKFKAKVGMSVNKVENTAKHIAERLSIE
ncbi:MAG: hypothetical protein PHZ27_05125 [Candidatus Omnitrophica bacterium]|nr:hypothetical protein [Candidatus Omnitrophota bacterium]